MASLELPGPSDQSSPKRPRPQDMDSELGDSPTRAKRLRAADEAALDDAQQVDALLSAVDDLGAEHDEVSTGLETDQPAVDKGKQRMPDERPDDVRNDGESGATPDDHSRNAQVVDELEAELSCGCCAGLVYRPMILQPCQHFFCASCLKQWIKNSDSNSCPECRTPSTHATASRTIQSIADLLVRHRPDLQRTENERKQADEICPPCAEIKMPQPKPVNPDVLLPQSRGHDPSADNFARPCPHCLPNNQFGWRCPRPVVDPIADPDHAWDLDEGPPPGHGFCGACSELHPLNAPGVTACSLCRTSFCGLSIPHLCVAHSVGSSRLPRSLNTLTGLLEAHSESIWEAFEFNDVEIEVLLDWLREGRYGAVRVIYQEVLQHVRNSPEGFEAMIEEGIFQADQQNINPLPAEVLSASRAASAPMISVSSSGAPPSFPHISLADPSSSSAASRLAQLTGFPRFSSSLGEDTAAGSSAVAVSVPSLSHGDESTSSAIQAQAQDLRFLFEATRAESSASAAGPLIDLAPTASSAPLVQPAAPLSGIPSTEQAQLIPPITPTQAAPNASSSTTAAAPEAYMLGRSHALPPSEFMAMMTDPAQTSSSSAPAPGTGTGNATASSSNSHSSVSRICRDCAFEIFLHELYPWWARERARVLELMAKHPVPQSTEGNPESSDAAAESSAATAAVAATIAPARLLIDHEDGGEDDSDDEGFHDGGAGSMGRYSAAGGSSAMLIQPGSLPSSVSPLHARLPDWVGQRPDCPSGRRCERQKEMSHAKEFNHIIVPSVPTPPAPERPTEPNSSGPSTSEQSAAPTGAVLMSASASQDSAHDNQDMDVDIAASSSLPILPSLVIDPEATGESSANASPHAISASSSNDSMSTAGHGAEGDGPTTPTLPGSHTPSGPIIAPSPEVHGPVIALSNSEDHDHEDILSGEVHAPKQLATPSEVLMDVALIRSGIANDSSSLTHDHSALPSSSSSIANTITYPNPSVEMVSSV